MIHLLQTKIGSSNFPEWVQWIIVLAPILSFAAALSNLLLALTAFRFSRRKNETDRNIKWFQELVYTPNKELIKSYFDALYSIKEKIPNNADLTEDESINLIDFVKEQRSLIMSGFVDVIKKIHPDTHTTISKAVDNLTDELSKSLSNDELKWNNPKTKQKEIIERVNRYRNTITVAFFSYKG